MRSLPRLAGTVRQWHLWSLRPAAVCLLLGVDLVASIALILVTTREPGPSGSQWLLFAVVAVCATTHLMATRPAEERRRAAHLGGKIEHIDQTGIWLFAAAILLPMHLVIALVVVLRGQRYLIARKRPSTFIATSFFISLSALGAYLVARLTPLHAWLSTGDTTGVPVPPLVLSASMLGAMAAYFGVQALLIAAGRLLITGGRTLTGLFGSGADNVLEGYTVLVGVFAAIVGAFAMPGLLVVTAVATYGTLTEQRMYQLQQEREKLEVDALHDALTGLPNRRGFEPQATLAMLAAEADHLASAVLMADLDHFKNWNTTLGHFGADQVLTAVAGVLRSSTRKTDLLCRWGGEELAIVMPDTKREEAAVLAERLRAAVENLTIEVTKPAGGQPTTVTGITISIGVAMMPLMGSTLAAAQEAADHALQNAKDNGRNQVRFAGPTLSPPLSA